VNTSQDWQKMTKERIKGKSRTDLCSLFTVYREKVKKSHNYILQAKFNLGKHLKKTKVLLQNMYLLNTYYMLGSISIKGSQRQCVQYFWYYTKNISVQEWHIHKTGVGKA
jgi:hypothetical protein